MSKKRVIIATGGTGGHIFPAQLLGAKLTSQNTEVLFLGGGLKNNRYFKKDKYDHAQITSSTPFKGNPLRSFYRIAKGVFQSLKQIALYKPHLVVGFGSFYTFPVILAAVWKKIPFVLFEPNAMPGKVNRFFSKWAKLSLIQFEEAQNHLKGKICRRFSSS